MTFVLLQNDRLHIVSFQIFEIFWTQSVGHLMVYLLPLYLIRIGFAGLGFVKSLKVFQLIWRNCYKSVENAEKYSEKRKISLREAMRWQQ